MKIIIIYDGTTIKLNDKTLTNWKINTQVKQN